MLDALSRREYEQEEEPLTEVDTPPYIELLPVETVTTSFYYEGDNENNETCDDKGDPAVLATVTIASLIGQ